MNSGESRSSRFKIRRKSRNLVLFVRKVRKRDSFTGLRQEIQAKRKARDIADGVPVDYKYRVYHDSYEG